MGWNMTKPIEISETTEKAVRSWFHDPKIINMLSSVHPALLFNADEVKLYKAPSNGMEPGPDGLIPLLPKVSCGGCLLSMFIIISAAGACVTPYALCHTKQQECAYASSIVDLKCYTTNSGTVDKDSFFNIMQDILIPYVDHLRATTLKGIPNDRAVLLVDGNRARYKPATEALLQKAGIDLVYLPDRSSKVTQPISKMMKDSANEAFLKQWDKSKPVTLLAAAAKDDKGPKKRGRPKKKKEDTSETATGITTLNSSSFTVYDSEKEAIERVGQHQYEQAKGISAAINAIQTTFTRGQIIDAWNQKKLFPFTGGCPFSQW